MLPEDAILVQSPLDRVKVLIDSLYKISKLQNTDPILTPQDKNDRKVKPKSKELLRASLEVPTREHSYSYTLDQTLILSSGGKLSSLTEEPTQCATSGRTWIGY